MTETINSSGKCLLKSPIERAKSLVIDFCPTRLLFCIVWSCSIWANAGLSHLHTAFTFQTQKLCTSFYRQDVIWSGSHSFSIPPADTSCLIALLSTWPIKGSVLHFIKSYSWILYPVGNPSYWTAAFGQLSGFFNVFYLFYFFVGRQNWQGSTFTLCKVNGESWIVFPSGVGSTYMCSVSLESGKHCWGVYCRLYKCQYDQCHRWQKWVG